MPAPLRALLRAIDLACAAGAALAALGAAAMAAILIAEVVGTSFFDWSQPWAVEFSGYALLAVLFAGSGWALQEGAHIRVTLVRQGLPPRGAHALDVLATAIALAVSAYASRALVLYAARSWELGSVSTYLSQTPLAWPQSVLAASFSLLTLALVARLIRLLAGEPAELPGAAAPE